jgi:hypothetical protein
MTLRWSPGYAAVDADFDSVSLLLHGDGTNGSTTIVDSSPSPKTVTAVGNAQISTAQSKFGGASIALDGNGDYLSIASNSDFAFTGDFTVEAWGYLLAAPTGANASYLTDFRAGGTGFTFGVIGSSGNARMYQYTSSPDVDVIGSSNVTLNVWNHLAYVRSGSTVTMYLNGSSQGTITSSFSQSTTPLIVGARFTANTEYWNGYIDDLRITKGVARYTANFTPPTAPFPDLSPTTRLTLP